MSLALLRVGASLSGLEKEVVVKNGREAYESFCHIYLKKIVWRLWCRKFIFNLLASILSILTFACIRYI